MRSEAAGPDAGDGSVGRGFSGRRGRFCRPGFWRAPGTVLWASVLADVGDGSVGQRFSGRRGQISLDQPYRYLWVSF